MKSEIQKIKDKFKIDLHMHTIASGHAFSTLNEMAREAANKKLEMIAITDHGPTTPGAPIDTYFRCGDRFPEILYGVHILFGTEANILNTKGELDLPEFILQKLDIVIAGFHDFEDLGIDKNTEAMIGAIKNPYVNIISHPYSSKIEVDIKKVSKIAMENNVLLEINASFFYKKRKANDRNAHNKIKKMVTIFKKHNKKLILTSDAHSASEIKKFDEVIEKFPELGLSENDFLLTKKDILEFLKK
jgi:putative hydrolase